jgi:GDPmannose 4,6-dehydratase
MKKKAIVTGVTGQDGSYLAELLLSKGYEVVGLKRRTSTNTENRISHIDSDDFSIVECEISDSGSVYSVIENHQPHEVYNLAAQSHVKTSFDQADYTFQVNTIGVVNFLEAIRRFSPHTRFYQASTSEMFGKNFDTYIPMVADAKSTPIEPIRFQDEDTVFQPQSPYAAAKLASHHLVRIYREGYGIFGCCGILFNHESERRGEHFVTRKITKWIGDFLRWEKENTRHALTHEAERFRTSEETIGVPPGRMFIDAMRNPSFPKLRLGNVDAYRDWGHAEDYVNAMWMMMQQEKPDDYVIATGETYSVREFLIEAFKYIGIHNYEDYFVVDPEFYRPAEVEYLKGIPAKAEDSLGWQRKVSFKDLVHRMLESDISNGQEEEARSQAIP